MSPFLWWGHWLPGADCDPTDAWTVGVPAGATEQQCQASPSCLTATVGSRLAMRGCVFSLVLRGCVLVEMRHSPSLVPTAGCPLPNTSCMCRDPSSLLAAAVHVTIAYRMLARHHTLHSLYDSPECIPTLAIQVVSPPPGHVGK